MREKTVNACLLVFIAVAVVVLLGMTYDLITGVPSI
jgi:hypothetical protein